MIRKITLCIILVLFAASLHAQEQKEKTPEERATEMVNKMEEVLALEPHQTFYVDSILTHDYRAWMDELEKYQKQGVQEGSVYVAVKDKWDAKIDSALAKVLTPEQFVEYQKLVGKYKKSKKNKK